MTSQETGPPIRIARNDPALAHAVSLAEIERLRQGSAKVFARIMAGAMTVSQVSTLLKGHFGPLLIDENVTRSRWGSMPKKASWLVLDAEKADSEYPTDLSIVNVMLDKARFQTYRAPTRIARHAVARYFQRTQAHSRIRGVASLSGHIAVAIQLILEHSVAVGDRVVTATKEGALLWCTLAGSSVGGVRLRASTWIGVDTAVEPELKEMMRSATDGEATVKITHARLRGRGRLSGPPKHRAAALG